MKKMYSIALIAIVLAIVVVACQKVGSPNENEFIPTASNFDDPPIPVDPSTNLFLRIYETGDVIGIYNSSGVPGVYNLNITPNDTFFDGSDTVVIDTFFIVAHVSSAYYLYQLPHVYNSGTDDAALASLRSIAPQGYLQFSGTTTTGNSRNYAVTLYFGTKPQHNNPSYVNCPEYKHTCAGNPCSSCAFTKDANGCIDGCDCTVYVSPGDIGYCNHTMTTALGSNVVSFITNKVSNLSL